ncbi:MAG: aromatic ring-hydroxylating dioxygenase subunit alpha [Gammaproteobacteria bacterium]|jgi:phenylpropionate dioxygenase-like ring-hydroxylating dioxygenase large terminal subunit|nr:aromatic ring-hydroxylating dioxygenase subunit alpha [Gammaproteobacteria bacterium]
MFINFWYVACTSSELTFGAPQPKKVMMLGHTFALWRDTAGKVQCISNTCTHRSGALGDGRIRGDCLECPYHGWTFNGQGDCVRLPSLGPDAKIPARTRVDAYPVEERYGLVHVFLGDLPEAERPPILDAPEFDDPDWHFIPLNLEWKIDYKRSVENTMDPAHNEFTHPTHGFLGAKEDYVVEDITLEDTDWGTGFMNAMKAPPLPQKEMREESGREDDGITYAGSGNHGPNCSWTFIHISDQAWFHGYAFHTPVHEKLDRVYGIFGRNFMTEAKYDKTFEDRSLYVAEQDRYVLEPMEPALSPGSNVNELLVPADKAIGRYREFCQEWEANGWRLDTKKIREDKDRVAYAIPSPARREHKSWVLPSVPLLKGSKPAVKAVG